ncbi:MAG: hypothetical protein B6242_05240 [Anaerolineaceae bacterium 4572_78]|nr:MAG: hypothetical protein B6242_05240 [Anaerolineaceae bacterium 4572_78]
MPRKSSKTGDTIESKTTTKKPTRKRISAKMIQKEEKFPDPLVEEALPPATKEIEPTPEPEPVVHEDVSKTAQDWYQSAKENIASNSLDLAKEELEQAHALYEKTDDQVGIADCLESLGTLHVMLADYEQAESYYQKSLNMKQSADDETGMANIRQLLRVVARLQG